MTKRLTANAWFECIRATDTRISNRPTIAQTIFDTNSLRAIRASGIPMASTIMKLTSQSAK